MRDVDRAIFRITNFPGEIDPALIDDLAVVFSALRRKGTQIMPIVDAGCSCRDNVHSGASSEPVTYEALRKAAEELYVEGF